MNVGQYGKIPLVVIVTGVWGEAKGVIEGFALAPHQPAPGITVYGSANIIAGVSVGMKATFIPTIAVATAVLLACHLGSSTGVGDDLINLITASIFERATAWPSRICARSLALLRSNIVLLVTTSRR